MCKSLTVPAAVRTKVQVRALPSIAPCRMMARKSLVLQCKLAVALIIKFKAKALIRVESYSARKAKNNSTESNFNFFFY